MISIDLKAAIQEAIEIAEQKEISLTFAYNNRFVISKISKATTYFSLVFQTMMNMKSYALILENELGISPTLDINAYSRDLMRRIHRYISNIECDYTNDKKQFFERLNEVKQNFSDTMELALEMQHIFHSTEALSRTVNPVFYKNDEKLSVAFLKFREAIRLFDILISELVLLKTFLYRISPSQTYKHTNFAVLENEK